MGSPLRSRLGAVLIFGAVLLALDVGRSIWARVALEVPTTEYRPDPAHYADLTWPPGADLRQDTPLGAKVFAQRCSVCHGPDGRGNGPAAPSMLPRPRDFSLGSSNTSLAQQQSRQPMKTYCGPFVTAFLQVRCRTLQIYCQPRSLRRSYSR